MTKLFHRFSQQSPIGLVADPSANAALVSPSLAIVSRLNRPALVHPRTGAVVSAVDIKSPASCIAVAPNAPTAAIASHSGDIHIYNIANPSNPVLVSTLVGHNSPVTCLVFHPSKSILASASADAQIILWDLLAEAGICRLIAHKDAITSLLFLPKHPLNHLVSASKDGLIKVWDLATNHPVESVVSHKGPIHSLAIHPINNNILFSGSPNGLIHIWSINHAILAAKLDTSTSIASADSSVPSTTPSVSFVGALQTSSQDRIITLKIDPSAAYLVSHGPDKTIDVFRIRTELQLEKILKKRLKKSKENTKDSSETADANNQENVLTINDRFPKISSIRCSAKIVSMDMLGLNLVASNTPVYAATNSSSTQQQLLHPGGLRFFCSLANNSVESHELTDSSPSSSAVIPSKSISTIDIQGHRSDIRSIALSSDDQLILSGSNTLTKIYSTHSHMCIKTFATGYVLCSSFLPGNKHAVIGTKSGHLEILDLASSSIVQSIQAHDGPIWSLQVRPDKQGLITGSQDKHVKFWDFSTTASSSAPSLVHTRSLKLSDDVLCVRQSPDSKLLAVSLLDTTVKLFYSDTLKYYLTLYGHTLPVLNMDISTDSSLIVTASSDKTIKIWGLEYGDCHKSLRAHDDSVTDIKFMFGTHMVWSASKDKTLKQWCCDTFQLIQTVNGHVGNVWCLDVAKYGRFVVSGSADRSIRVWTRSDDVFTLEEERDRELEQLYDQSNTMNGVTKYNSAVGSGVPDINDRVMAGSGDVNGLVDNQAVAVIQELGGAAKTEAMKYGDRIMESLDIYVKWCADTETYQQLLLSSENKEDVVRPPMHPAILATGMSDVTPCEYVLHVMAGVTATQLETVLLIVPSGYIEPILRCVNEWIKKKWNPRIVSRILTHMLTNHFTSITASTIVPLMTEIRDGWRIWCTQIRDQCGFNYGVGKLIYNEVHQRHVVVVDEMEVNETDDAAKGGKKRSRSGQAKRVVVKS